MQQPGKVQFGVECVGNALQDEQRPHLFAQEFILALQAITLIEQIHVVICLQRCLDGFRWIFHHDVLSGSDWGFPGFVADSTSRLVLSFSGGSGWTKRTPSSATTESPKKTSACFR